MPLLEFEKVSKEFGRVADRQRRRRQAAGKGVKALAGVDLSVDEGEAVALVGESGAGKTTLAMLAAGLEQPSTGRVNIDGSSRDKSGSGVRRRERLERARRLQLVWQDVRGSLDPRMKIAAAVAEPLRIHGLAAGADLDKKVEGLLDEVGLDASLGSRRPHELSGGEVQRAVIARALALDPAVLVCDEPAASLDAGAKVRIARLLTRLRHERSLALLVISHDLPLVRFLTEKIFVIYRGRIVESGPTAAVFDNPLHPYTRLLVSCDPSAPGWAQMIEGGDATQPSGGAQSDGGCGYAARCSCSMKACLADLPRLSRRGSDRQVACHNPAAAGSAADVLEDPVERLAGFLEG